MWGVRVVLEATLWQVSGPSLPNFNCSAIAMDKLLKVGDAKMTEVANDFVASKPGAASEDTTQAIRDSDQDWWETGVPSQKVRMDFACAFGFMTFKEIEFLPDKREMRNLEKIT